MIDISDGGRLENDHVCKEPSRGLTEVGMRFLDGQLADGLTVVLVEHGGRRQRVEQFNGTHCDMIVLVPTHLHNSVTKPLQE